MLIETNKGEVINLDNISGLFIDSSELICYIPSTNPTEIYQKLYLGVNYWLYITLVTRQIQNLYKQLVITESGNMIVPNQVYRIPASVSASYYNMSQVSVDRSNESSSQRLIEGNRLYVDHILSYNGTRLRPDADYSCIFPLYRGKNKSHTAIYILNKSKSKYYVNFTATYSDTTKKTSLFGKS